MRNRILKLFYGIGLCVPIAFANAKSLSRPEIFDMALKQTAFMLNAQPTLAHQAYYLDQNVSGPSTLDKLTQYADQLKTPDHDLFKPLRLKSVGQGSYTITYAKMEPLTFEFLQTPSPGRKFDLKINGKMISLGVNLSGEIDQDDEAKLAAFVAAQIVPHRDKTKAKSTATFLFDQLVPSASAMWPAIAFIYGIVTKVIGDPLKSVDSLDNLCFKINIARNKCDETKAQLQMDSQSFWAGTNTDMYKVGEYVNHTNKMGIEYNSLSGKILPSLYVAGFCAAINNPKMQKMGTAVVDWTGPYVDGAMKKAGVDPGVLTVLCRENLQKLNTCMDVIFKKGAERYQAKSEVKMRDPNCPVLNYYTVELEHDNEVFPSNEDQSSHTEEMAHKFTKMLKSGNAQNMMLNPSGAAIGNAPASQ